jgi:hypothetical protein
MTLNEKKAVMELSTGTCKHVQDVIDFYEANGRAPLPLSGEARTDDAVLERRLYERLKRLRQVSAIIPARFRPLQEV